MTCRNPDNTQYLDLDAVLGVIVEIARKSVGGNYIYRGERKPYPKVSSSLYRRYEEIENEDFDIEIVQDEILSQARGYTRYTGETDDLDILSQLQHNGGETNLIDFTTDYLIALFFACDGEPSESGRVILLSELGDGYDVEDPRNPVHRVIAQKSVFVRPHKGFIEPDDSVIIPNDLKSVILNYLRNHHGISTETIYNDLLGFIRHQGIHQSAYAEFYRGVTSAEKENYQQAIRHYSKAIELNLLMAAPYNNRGNVYLDLGDYISAIADYYTALAIDPEYARIHHNIGLARANQGNYPDAIQEYTQAIELAQENDEIETTYYLRGEIFLHLGQWDDARQDLENAIAQGMDIITWFRINYENVADFEMANGFKLPEDITQMLGG